MEDVQNKRVGFSYNLQKNYRMVNRYGELIFLYDFCRRLFQVDRPLRKWHFPLNFRWLLFQLKNLTYSPPAHNLEKIIFFFFCSSQLGVGNENSLLTQNKVCNENLKACGDTYTHKYVLCINDWAFAYSLKPLKCCCNIFFNTTVTQLPPRAWHATKLQRKWTKKTCQRHQCVCLLMTQQQRVACHLPHATCRNASTATHQ